MANGTHLEKLALVVGGGPAPGINGVISAVTIEAINNGIQVFGIQNGFKGLVQGNTECLRLLEIDDVRAVALRGGSVLGTSRTNPAKNAEHMAKVLGVFRDQGINALVTIGGDDTAYTSSEVYRIAEGTIRVAHVPKTIDNDLPLPGSAPTFGFETARQLGVQIVRNVAEDARTTSRWYLIVSMGRAAGHLALGIGKASAATLTIIPEEFRGRKVTLDELCDIILGAIIKRASFKTYHGVVVLAEGLIGALGEDQLTSAMDSGVLGRYGSISRDPHGHLRLGEIEFGRMIRDLLSSRLDEFGIKTTLIDKDLGYELRCADPIPFDAEYTRDLGYGAVKFLRSDEAGKFGAVISYVEGRMKPLPFAELLNPETKRMKNRIVNVEGEGYECARRYMLRLEKKDFDEPVRLGKIAAAAGMTPEQFRQRFFYLVERDRW